jgi:hypothetical protein
VRLDDSALNQQAEVRIPLKSATDSGVKAAT